MAEEQALNQEAASPTAAEDGLPGRPLEAPPAIKEPMRFVTIRSMAIACALIPAMALWVALSEAIWYSSHSTAISLFYHVTFVVFVLALVNLAVGRFWPRAALSSAEIMTIYVMLAVAGTFVSHDLLQILVPALAYPVHHANPENRWGELVLKHLPEWAIVTDKDAAAAVAVGNSSMYSWAILRAWIVPLAFWFSFLLVLMLALLCVNIFFRQPWTEKERLRFPIIQIPMMLAGELSTLLRSQLFWIGFGIAFGIDIINNLNHLYPNIPQIPIVNAFRFGDYLIERPWNAMAGVNISLYPFVIGLAFFLPTDLAFSCWFFFLFYRMQLVVTSAIGIRDVPGLPFAREQGGGGYIALGLIAIWLSRRHLVGALRTVFGRPGGIDDSAEPMRFRTAFICLVASTVALVIMGTLLGASWYLVFVFFLIFFVYSIAIARMRAELGPPAHDLHHMGPDVIMQNAVGTHAMGEGNLAGFAQFHWFNRAYRAHFSAHCMEGLKAAQLTRTRSRSMMIAIMVAVVVGAAAGVWAMMHAIHVHGCEGHVAGVFGFETWNHKLASPLSTPQGPRIAATVAMVIGAVFALFLGAMRMKFAWWLWHPVGYATSMSWSMGKVWFCVFMAWLVKVLITRYGGTSAYRKAIPLFVGIVLGEFTVGALFSIYGAIYSVPVYHFWG